MVGRKKWGCPIFHSIPLVFLLSRKLCLLFHLRGEGMEGWKMKGFFMKNFAIAET